MPVLSNHGKGIIGAGQAVGFARGQSRCSPRPLKAHHGENLRVTLLSSYSQLAMLQQIVRAGKAISPCPMPHARYRAVSPTNQTERQVIARGRRPGLTPVGGCVTV